MTTIKSPVWAKILNPQLAIYNYYIYNHNGLAGRLFNVLITYLHDCDCGYCPHNGGYELPDNHWMLQRNNELCLLKEHMSARLVSQRQHH